MQLQNVTQRFTRWADYFSFGIILRTLFAPFRQIAAGKVEGSIDVMFRAWLDRTVSRAIGFVVRVCVLFAGVVWVLFLVISALLQLAGWLLLPATPILGALLAAVRWLPWLN